VENAFCAFSKELVGAFSASTAPAASIAPRDLASRDGFNELGCLVGSARGALRLQRHERICALARQSVESIQWGIAPLSASTGLMRRHGTPSPLRGGIHEC
jgi:hypothetical protein